MRGEGMREEGFEDVRGISELLPSLMEELETTWRRIGVELERLGISTGILSEPIQPSACPGLSSIVPHRVDELVRERLRGDVFGLSALRSLEHLMPDGLEKMRLAQARATVNEERVEPVGGRL